MTRKHARQRIRRGDLTYPSYITSTVGNLGWRRDAEDGNSASDQFSKAKNLLQQLLMGDRRLSALGVLDYEHRHWTSLVHLNASKDVPVSRTIA